MAARDAPISGLRMSQNKVRSDICRSRINHQLDFRDAICWEASEAGMDTKHLFVRSDVDTVDRVSRYIAVQPLDLRPEFIQYAARFLRDREHLIGCYISDAGKLAVNNILGHVSSFLVSLRAIKKGDAQPQPASPAAYSCEQLTWSFQSTKSPFGLSLQAHT